MIINRIPLWKWTLLHSLGVFLAAHSLFPKNKHNKKNSLWITRLSLAPVVVESNSVVWM
jgi:hypothetical protein